VRCRSILLEKLKLAADRRLRHVQPVRSTSEGAFFGDGAEHFELAHIHVPGMLSRNSMARIGKLIWTHTAPVPILPLNVRRRIHC
jgi:hypothetical protein